MFKPLSLFIALRYIRAKRRSHFISFISLSSLIGIALGVMVLIIVLSVMNGFDEAITEQIYEVAQHITISNYQGRIANWPALEEAVLAQSAHIKGSAPFIGGQGLLNNRGLVRPAIVTGILPQKQQTVVDLAAKMRQGDINVLQANSFTILLGEQLADNLGVDVGDKITLMIPSLQVSAAGLTPRFKRFTVAGIFSFGDGFHYDSNVAFIHLQDAQTLYQLGDNVTALRLQLDSLYAAPSLSLQLLDSLPEGYHIANWTYQFGALFKAIKLEKTMMFAILLFIIAIAAFNLVSSLVMVVNDKQADIAIMRTLGATPKIMFRIFILQGMLLGGAGIIFGALAGYYLSQHLTPIVQWLERVFHVQFVSANVYFIDYLPSKILLSDLWHIVFAAFLMSFLATLYPAWRALRVQPAEALRYE